MSSRFLIQASIEVKTAPVNNPTNLIKRKKPMKKLILTFVLVLSLFLLFSCSRGAYSVLMGQERNTPTSMAMTYEKFNGYKERTFTVGEDEHATVYVSFITESGELDAYITKEGDTEHEYIGNDVVNSTFTVDLTEEGKYTVRVEGKDHSGEYNFQWEIEKSK